MRAEALSPLQGHEEIEASRNGAQSIGFRIVHPDRGRCAGVGQSELWTRCRCDHGLLERLGTYPEDLGNVIASAVALGIARRWARSGPATIGEVPVEDQARKNELADDAGAHRTIRKNR